MNRTRNFAFGISLLFVSVVWAYDTFSYMHTFVA